MSRILLRSGKDPFEVVPPELALELYPRGLWGRNVGNLVFTDAMHKIVSVPGAQVVSNSFLSERPGITREYVARVDEEFDHFVIPLANAFRTSFMGNLRRLTQVIEGLSIPVTVVGVGVAGGVGSLDRPLPQLTDRETATVQRFVRAVLDHSATIGVRGEFTREYLATLGFGDEHVDVVGCPSLYRDGADLQITKRATAITPESRFTMNLSPYVKMMGPLSVRHAEKYPHMVYIPQGDDTLELMMWGKEPENVRRSGTLPNHLEHPLYQSNRMRYFVDTTTWMDYLAQQDFSFGTRIHGNIAALSARTPAVVLAHDARTLELARYHDIPHRMVPELDASVDAADLYEWASFDGFNRAQRANVDRFSAFLVKNGIEHIHEPGKANPEYDERLAATPFPRPVETLMTNDPVARLEAIERVALLRDVAGPDAWRARFTPHHAVPHHVAPGAPTRASTIASRAVRRVRSALEPALRTAGARVLRATGRR